MASSPGSDLSHINNGRLYLDREKLKRWRRNKGLSQDSLAEACTKRGLYLSIASIKRAESGKRVLYRTARQLAHFYDVDVSALILEGAETGDLLPEKRRDLSVRTVSSNKRLGVFVCYKILKSRDCNRYALHELHESIAVIIGRAKGTRITQIDNCHVFALGIDGLIGDEFENGVSISNKIINLAGHDDKIAGVSIGLHCGCVVDSGPVRWPLMANNSAALLAVTLAKFDCVNEILVTDVFARSTTHKFSYTQYDNNLYKQLAMPVWKYQSTKEPEDSKSQLLAGREFEMNQFRHTIKACKSCKLGHLVYIRGVAGIGKSRLLNEFMNVAAVAGFKTAGATILNDQETSWYTPLTVILSGLFCRQGYRGGVEERRDVVEKIAEDLHLDMENRIYLYTLFDVSRAGLQVESSARISHTERHHGLHNLFVRLLQSLKAPVVIGLDDVHWATPHLLLGLKYIVANINQLPVTLVLVSRLESDPIDAIWRSSIVNTQTITFDLSPLSRRDLYKIAAYYRHLGEDYLNHCIELAAGNPLFLEQLLLNYPNTPSSLPTSLQLLVQSKVDNLDEINRQALNTASAAGHVFDARLIRDLIGQADYDFSCLQRQFLIKYHDIDQYVFVHGLIRKGVYEIIAEAEKSEIHLKISSWYKQRNQSVYAKHLAKSNSFHAAPKAFLHAARELYAQQNYGDAHNMVDRALAIARNSREQYPLYLLKGILLRLLDLPEKAIRPLKLAMQYSHGNGQLCEVWLELALLYKILKRSAEFNNAFEQARNLRSRVTDNSIQAKFSNFEQEVRQPGGSGDNAFQSIVDAAGIYDKIQAAISKMAAQKTDALADVGIDGAVQVGVLHSKTGVLRELESGVIKATLFAIGEINDNGGLLGKRIDPVFADGCSKEDLFAKGAEYLIHNRNVSTLFGCSTSSSRRRVRPIVEKSESVLIYPFQYEGIEQSENIFYVGPAPNQQAIPSVEWLYANGCKRFFLLGSDYIYPHVTNTIIKNRIENLGAHVVGEAYIPLGGVDFEKILERLDHHADAIVLTLVGLKSNYEFFRLYHQARKRRNIRILSLVLSENDLESIPVAWIQGTYTVFSYFQNIDDPINDDFVRRFKNFAGQDLRIGGYMASAYNGVYLWAKAVQMSKSFDPKVLKSAIKGISHYGPGGMVYVDEKNNHAWQHVRVARVENDGEFHVIWNSQKPISPDPYPGLSVSQWGNYLDQLNLGWGGRWENIFSDPLKYPENV